MDTDFARYNGGHLAVINAVDLRTRLATQHIVVDLTSRAAGEALRATNDYFQSVLGTGSAPCKWTAAYTDFYNAKRCHSALGGELPIMDLKRPPEPSKVQHVVSILRGLFLRHRFKRMLK